MTAKDVSKELERNGWELVSQTGSHKKYRKNEQNCIVPDHGSKEIRPGTLKSIQKMVTLAESKN